MKGVCIRIVRMIYDSPLRSEETAVYQLFHQRGAVRSKQSVENECDGISVVTYLLLYLVCLFTSSSAPKADIVIAVQIRGGFQMLLNRVDIVCVV